MTFPAASLRKISFFLSCFLSISCTAMPPVASNNTDQEKAAAERIIRPNNGKTAIVFNEKGEPTVLDQNGKAVPACQICTPELETRYGPKCAKARQASLLKEASTDQNKSAPVICDKLMSTDVQAVNPVTVINHTGSKCTTFIFYAGGQMFSYQQCF